MSRVLKHCTSAGVLLMLCSYAISTPLSASVQLNEQQEEKYLELLKELRCLVCQNQSLAESGSGLASDLREQVRAMIAEGKDNEAIKDYAVERYSEFILYDPRFKPETYALWLAPLLFLVLGMWFLLRQIARQRQKPAAEK